MSFTHGEAVIASAHLSEKWLQYRMCTCMWAAAHISLLWAPIYALFGGSCRREERNSFKLVLTPTALHFQQMSYGCGICCEATVTKTIPLDKIQDVNLVADCCGDCCGCSEGPRVAYKMAVQTAGLSGVADAELSIACIEDMNNFRAAIFAAKRALGSGGGVAVPTMMIAPTIAGGDKYQHNSIVSDTAPLIAAAKSLAVLERIEQLIITAVENSNRK
jgi:hypothetical protein